MDNTGYNAAGRTSGSQGRGDQPAQARNSAKPRPVLWTGQGIDRECADFVPTLWDGTCLV